MSSLYRPAYTTYRMPDGAYRIEGKRVTASTPDAVRIEAESPFWWGRWTDGAGQEHQRKLSKSKETARRMLAKLAGDGQLASVGIVDPFALHRFRPLLEHLEDYGRVLAAKGDAAEHVKRALYRCRSILAGVEAEAIGDVQPSAVLEFLASLRIDRVPCPLADEQEWFTRVELAESVGINKASVARVLKRDRLEGHGVGRARRYARAVVESLRDRLCRGASISTTNQYLTAIKGFTRWLVRDGRTPVDPLLCLSRQNAAADVRVIRRTLAPEEFAEMLRAARQGRTFRGLDGRTRAVLYPLAARSGLRASELASLSPASFDWQASTVTVEAAYSKRRRRDVQPLPPDIAALVRDFARGRAPGDRLFLGLWFEVGAEMLRADLQAAGVPFVDDAGRVYDFHALRHQFITDLADAGVHPRDAQALARHSTITLTMDRYTHVRPANLDAALGRLPSLAGDDAPDGGKARRKA